MKEHIIVRVIARILIPFIQLYALYVIAHGEIGPGGGFQGGVIFSASIILYVLAFGMEEARSRISQKMSDLLSSTGALIFAIIGLLCILAGGSYLEYDQLPLGTPKLASHLGIYGIEIGIGITVAAVLITIFFEMAGRKDD
ncbi:MAG: Na(+)/H(+) antiporter subunit B [Candidatus Marinimicrobia bacterium]|nr:Na(+)/H(+) antiporter subunit B [Candidatus Neomarinimicrobiota bacterium]